LGIGDWGLGIGPNPQSPIPNPQSPHNTYTYINHSDIGKRFCVEKNQCPRLKDDENLNSLVIRENIFKECVDPEILYSKKTDELGNEDIQIKDIVNYNENLLIISNDVENIITEDYEYKKQIVLFQKTNTNFENIKNLEIIFDKEDNINQIDTMLYSNIKPIKIIYYQNSNLFYLLGNISREKDIRLFISTINIDSNDKIDFKDTDIYCYTCVVDSELNVTEINNVTIANNFLFNIENKLYFVVGYTTKQNTQSGGLTESIVFRIKFASNDSSPSRANYTKKYIGNFENEDYAIDVLELNNDIYILGIVFQNNKYQYYIHWFNILSENMDKINELTSTFSNSYNEPIGFGILNKKEKKLVVVGHSSKSLNEVDLFIHIIDINNINTVIQYSDNPDNTHKTKDVTIYYCHKLISSSSSNILLLVEEVDNNLSKSFIYRFNFFKDKFYFNQKIEIEPGVDYMNFSFMMKDEFLFSSIKKGIAPFKNKLFKHEICYKYVDVNDPTNKRCVEKTGFPRSDINYYDMNVKACGNNNFLSKTTNQCSNCLKQDNKAFYKYDCVSPPKDYCHNYYHVSIINECLICEKLYSEKEKKCIKENILLNPYPIDYYADFVDMNFCPNKNHITLENVCYFCEGTKQSYFYKINNEGFTKDGLTGCISEDDCLKLNDYNPNNNHLNTDLKICLNCKENSKIYYGYDKDIICDNKDAFQAVTNIASNGKCITRNECKQFYHVNERNECLYCCNETNYFHSIDKKCAEINLYPKAFVNNGECPYNFPDGYYFNGECPKDINNIYSCECKPKFNILEFCLDNEKIILPKNSIYSQCIKECPLTHYYFPDTNRCFECNPNSLFIYNNECVKECPERYTVFMKTCILCDDYYNPLTQVCQNPCKFDEITNETLRLCIKCFSPTKFYYAPTNECLNECPENWGGVSRDKFECFDVTGKFYLESQDLFVEKCPNDMFGDPILKKCVYCDEVKKLEVIINKKYTCVDKCPESYILQGNKCILCQSNTVSYNPTFSCVDICPEGTEKIYNSLEKFYICEKCTFYNIIIQDSFPQTECVEICDIGYVSNENGKCLKCVDIGYYMLNSQCVKDCGTDYIPNNKNICILNENLNDNNDDSVNLIKKGFGDNCDISTCNFNGVCIADNGEMKCKCIDNFVEIFCKYTKSDVDKLIKDNMDYITFLQNAEDSDILQKLVLNMSKLNEVNLSLFPKSENLIKELNVISSKLLEGMMSSGNINPDVMSLADLTLSNSGNSNSNIAGLIDKLSTNMIINPNSGIQFSGSNFSIGSFDNSSESIQSAVNNNLPVIDSSECEKILIKEGILKEGDKLFSINLRMNPSLKNLDKSAQDFVKTRYVNGNGEEVDTSKCTTISVKMPNKNLSIDMEKYNALKKQGVEILDQNGEFFNDLCVSFQSEDGKDITINQRRNIFKDSASCVEGCIFKGLDENGYSNCECNSSVTEITNSVAEKKFSFEIKSNIGIVKCYKRVLENVKNNISFYTYFTITLVTLLIVGSYIIFYNYQLFIDNNFEEIRNNDFKEKYLPEIDYKEYLIDKATDLKYLNKENQKIPMAVGSGNISKNSTNEINSFQNNDDDSKSIICNASLNLKPKLQILPKVAIIKKYINKSRRKEKIHKKVKKMIKKELTRLKYLYLTDINNNILLNKKSEKQSLSELKIFISKNLEIYINELNSFSLLSIKRVISFKRRKIVFIENNRANLFNYCRKNLRLNPSSKIYKYINDLDEIELDDSIDEIHDIIEESEPNCFKMTPQILRLKNDNDSIMNISDRINLKNNKVDDSNSYSDNLKLIDDYSKLSYKKEKADSFKLMDNSLKIEDGKIKKSPIKKYSDAIFSFKVKDVFKVKVKEAVNNKFDFYRISCNILELNEVFKYVKLEKYLIQFNLCYKNYIRYLKRREFQKITNVKIKSEYENFILNDETYCQYFISQMKENHPILNLIFYKSILVPFFIRFLELVLEISMAFFFNAVFFDDAMIESRSKISEKSETLTKSSSSSLNSEEPDESLGLVLYQDVTKALISSIIPTFIRLSISFLNSPIKKYKIEIARHLAKGNKSLTKFVL
jgi:hypothetical protein